jgi:predicted RNA-binding Zn ribbon-like protein
MKRVVVEPGGRAPAPEPVRLVQRFVNTNNREGVERLGDAAALGDWLSGVGLLGPGVALTAADHARAVLLREALRDLAAANAGLPSDVAGALDTVNAAGRRAGLRPVLSGPRRSELEPSAAGLDAALGQIVGAVHAGIADRTWPRLKVCERETCRWAFYDQSKNGVGRWCSMAVCGSREKNRRAYTRRRARESG